MKLHGTIFLAHIRMYLIHVLVMYNNCNSWIKKFLFNSEKLGVLKAKLPLFSNQSDTSCFVLPSVAVSLPLVLPRHLRRSV